jgi:hypothetical protein
MKKWSRGYDECIVCHQVEFPHESKGLCKRCYETKRYLKNNPNKDRYLNGKHRNINLPKIYLISEYVHKEKSALDIAKENNCTKTLVYYFLKKYEIKRRTVSEARKLAFERKKIFYTQTDRDGNIKQIHPERNKVDDYFFSKWSASMAWVLGFIYTDGCLYSGKSKRQKKFLTERIDLSQSEPEILEKIKFLMRSNQRIVHQKVFNKNGKVTDGYHLVFWSKQIISDLKKIGLTPRKSLTMTFPDVPQDYVWHFIRGCWDGDGCIYITNRTGKINSAYITGSVQFMNKLVEILKSKLVIENLNAQYRSNAYTIYLSTKNTLNLCHKFYDGVLPDLYLSRKFKVYMDYLVKVNLTTKQY